MFAPFFYTLRSRGVPVTPTAFLRLQKALSLGLVESLGDFYTVARSILVKSERDFDTYDRVFAEQFEGVAAETGGAVEVDDAIRALLDEWLKEPDELAKAMGLSTQELKRMSADELLNYFLERLMDQKGVHRGGRKWIGVGGIAPVGHSGSRPGGMRVGGVSRNRSAIVVALERRYRDYAQDAPLTRAQTGEALKRLRHMLPAGPKDRLNVEKTIDQTMRNAGEIEIVFDRRLADKLKVVLLIDNGGWSMDPYVETVRSLFHHAQTQFKELSIYYFHNTVRDRVWRDAQRRSHPELVDMLVRRDPETRLIVVGDASMAPEELFQVKSIVPFEDRQKMPSIDRLKQLAAAFRHAVWLNPAPDYLWDSRISIRGIRQVFPMFPLNLTGLERAVAHLTAR